MKKGIRHYLDDLLDYCERIEDSTENYDEAEFSQNLQLQDASLRRIEIIGEISRRIPEEIKQQYPEVSWREIAGIRNVIAHSYESVDMKQLWEIMRKDVPLLKQQIEKISKEYLS